MRLQKCLHAPQDGSHGSAKDFTDIITLFFLYPPYSRKKRIFYLLCSHSEQQQRQQPSHWAMMIPCCGTMCCDKACVITMASKKTPKVMVKMQRESWASPLNLLFSAVMDTEMFSTWPVDVMWKRWVIVVLQKFSTYNQYLGALGALDSTLAIAGCFLALLKCQQGTWGVSSALMLPACQAFSSSHCNALLVLVSAKEERD